MNTQTTTSATCAGCSRTFNGERGLRSHQSGRHTTGACRPMKPAEPTYIEKANSLADELGNAHLDGIRNARTLAWDSAVDNADLTMSEERIERWSERYCYILVSSFDPTMFEAEFEVEADEEPEEDVTSTGTFEGKTAEEWRALATRRDSEAAESWERSDTDGFLTQWANQKNAQEYLVKAQLAEQDGYWDFFALFDVDGNRLYAEQIEGQYGLSWRIFDPETKRTIRWFSESNAKDPERARKANLKKGVVFGQVRAEARVVGVGDMVSLSYGIKPADRYMLDGVKVENLEIRERF